MSEIARPTPPPTPRAGSMRDAPASRAKLQRATLDPAMGDLLGAVRTGPGWLAGARFTVAQALLGSGFDAPARIRAWMRRHTIEQERRARGSAGVVRWALKTPARVVRDAMTAVRVHGAACAAAYGVSPRRQLVHLAWLGLTRNLEPASYYRYWLHLPERRRRAGHYAQKPDVSVLYRVLVAREAPDDFAILEDKARFAEWCAEHGFPHPPIVAEFRDGSLVAPDAAALACPQADLFSKLTDRYGGTGACAWRHVGPGRWMDAEGLVHDQAALLAALAGQSHEGGVVLQVRMTNAEVLHPIAPHALCTLRVLTGRAPGGAPEVLAATFRTALATSASDNYSQGGMAAAVDLATGRLRLAVRDDPLLMNVAVETHPDTGAPFAGFPVPHWQEALALALAAHARLHSIAFVGWDVAFTPRGLILLEGNFNPGVILMQSGWGPALGDTPYMRIMDAHLRRTFQRRQ